jgi:putative DNA primase/helicase
MTTAHQFAEEAFARAKGPTSKAALLASTAASGIEMKAIEWLWPDRFAIGKLGLIVGLPDEGKGQLFYYIAARITSKTDKQWPCGEGVAPDGNVILLTAEDDLGDTVVPRLEAAGADRSRVHIIKMVHHGDDKRMFSLLSDLELLRNKVIEIGNVVLILIDPISAYLGHGRLDTFRTSDVRAVLAPLVDLAAEQKTAIIGILHFNKKVDVTNALLRISDSLAFGAAARHVYATVDDREHERKLLVRGKNNLSCRADRALAYRFAICRVGTDPTSGKEIWAPYIVWDNQPVDVTASEAMQAAAEARPPAARDDAKKFLTELLAAGPVLKAEIEEAASANGIAERTLFRAKGELGIMAKRDGPNGGWRWHPAEQEAPTRRWDGND